MATTQEASNKETFRRFCDAMNTGDTEVISKTIDELVDPDAVIGTPLPIEGTEDQLGLVLVVPATAKRDVLDGGGAAPGIGPLVVALDEGFFRAPASLRGDEGATVAVTPADRPSDVCGHVA